MSGFDQAERLLAALRAKGWRLVTAESCTGGLLAGAITDVPGSSDVFDRGLVSYSYPSKTDLLGVAPDVLHQHGAVSEPVAEAMATGALARADARIAIATTGVAGPGASEAKPEGMVWIAVATPDETRTRLCQFGAQGRDKVRALSVEAALDLALQLVGDCAP